MWGVAITSAIIQTTLKNQLPTALHGVKDRNKIIESVRHSVDALRGLAPDVQLPVRLVYYDGMRYAFTASTVIASLGLFFSLFARPQGLRSTK